MEDSDIIDLFLKRSENAITQTDKKYRGYLHNISYNILCNSEDSEECINDTYMKTWTTIPPTIPKMFIAYIGKIIRNISLNVYKKNRRVKRGKGEIHLVLDELQECIESDITVEAEIEKKELTKLLNDFINEMNTENKEIFIRRYWYVESISKIAERYNISESKVKSVLFRQRNKLKDRLKLEMYC